MKRIIAFVLFALIIYAGGYCVAYGVNELLAENTYPFPLENVSSDMVHNGTVLSGKVYQHVQYLGKDTIRAEFFNIPIGKPIERRFYLVPFKYEKKATDLRYYVVCVSGKESIAQMEKLWVDMPKPESGGGFELTGVAKEMAPAMKSRVYNVLITRTQLVDDRIVNSPIADYYYNRIIPWTVYERQDFGSGRISIVIGAALILGGIIPALILGIKIYRERY